MHKLKGITINGEFLGNGVVINGMFRAICAISPAIMREFIHVINKIDSLNEQVRISNFNCDNATDCMDIEFENDNSKGVASLYFKLHDGEPELTDCKLVFDNKEFAMAEDTKQDVPENVQESEHIQPAEPEPTPAETMPEPEMSDTVEEIPVEQETQEISDEPEEIVENNEIVDPIVSEITEQIKQAVVEQVIVEQLETDSINEEVIPEPEETVEDEETAEPEIINQDTPEVDEVPDTVEDVEEPEEIPAEPEPVEDTVEIDETESEQVVEDPEPEDVPEDNIDFESEDLSDEPEEDEPEISDDTELEVDEEDTAEVEDSVEDEPEEIIEDEPINEPEEPVYDYTEVEDEPEEFYPEVTDETEMAAESEFEPFDDSEQMSDEYPQSQYDFAERLAQGITDGLSQGLSEGLSQGLKQGLQGFNQNPNQKFNDDYNQPTEDTSSGYGKFGMADDGDDAGSDDAQDGYGYLVNDEYEPDFEAIDAKNSKESMLAQGSYAYNENADMDDLSDAYSDFYGSLLSEPNGQDGFIYKDSQEELDKLQAELDALNEKTLDDGSLTLSEYLAQQRAIEEAKEKILRRKIRIVGSGGRINAKAIDDGIFVSGSKVYRWGDVRYLDE